MRFVCLIEHDQQWFNRASAQEKIALHDDSMAYDDVLARQGQLVVAHALRAPAEARTVRVRKRKLMVTDGPFAETKEQLIGFILIEARDMDEAVAIAAGIPLAQTGTVTIREAYFAAQEEPAV